MKYLLVTALILGIFWLWRHTPRVPKNPAARPRPPAHPGNGVTEIVACSVCQMHLPHSEALIGRTGGLYCSEAHRHEAAG